MDGIVEQISRAFISLQNCITWFGLIETPGDDLHNFDDTADLFSAWLRNAVVIREECKTFENCLSKNPELKDTLTELLLDVKDDLSEAQDSAHRTLDNRSRGNARIAAVGKNPDNVPVLDLGTIPQDVYNTTICLMRLSKPLLDTHRRHQMTTRRCDKDDSHHVSHLQRIFPRAKSEILERLSSSICARRFEILRMNAHRKGLGPALGDDAFLRVVLLELATVSDEAIQHQDKEVSYSYKKVQRHEETIYEAKSHGGQKAKQASAASLTLIDHGSSDDGPIVHTVTVCTRCRVRRRKCDPGLPKCGPCERTGSTCEYYDSSKDRVLNRNYIVYLQLKVRELEDELARAIAATDQEPTSKNCVMCRRDVMHSDKSELRQHYFHDLKPYTCLHDDCSYLRYSTIDEWTEHIRGSHGQTWRCMFECGDIFFARTAFEEHMIDEHRAQFTNEELSTLAELCMKHTLPSNVTQCPCCGEIIDGPDRFYRHLAKHMEDVALLSLTPDLPCEYSEATKMDVQPTVKTPSALQPKTSVQYLSPVQHHEMEQPSEVHAGLMPPPRPSSSLSHASSLDDLLGGPPSAGAKKSTVKGGKKKGGRYVDVMAGK